MSNALGDQLKTVRQFQGRSLRAVAEPARISVAYLQKLERGDVREPSPNVLKRLSDALDVPYEMLMALAGYVVPSQPQLLASRSRFDSALASTELSEEEQRAVAAFIMHLRSQRNGSSRPAPRATH